MYVCCRGYSGDFEKKFKNLWCHVPRSVFSYFFHGPRGGAIKSFPSHLLGADIYDQGERWQNEIEMKLKWCEILKWNEFIGVLKIFK